MSDKEQPTAPSGTIQPLADQMMPEGRLAPNQTAIPSFENAQSEHRESETDSDADGSSDSGDRRRFEEIKAECRYCGRSLEPDNSL